MKTPSTIRIAIADDHTVMRSGLAELIRTLGDFEITLQVSNGALLLEELAKANGLPHVCILDINMPELNGYETPRSSGNYTPRSRYWRCLCMKMNSAL